MTPSRAAFILVASMIAGVIFGIRLQYNNDKYYKNEFEVWSGVFGGCLVGVVGGVVLIVIAAIMLPLITPK